jgi:hypothetical protein
MSLDRPKEVKRAPDDRRRDEYRCAFDRFSVSFEQERQGIAPILVEAQSWVAMVLT